MASKIYLDNYKSMFKILIVIKNNNKKIFSLSNPSKIKSLSWLQNTSSLRKS